MMTPAISAENIHPPPVRSVRAVIFAPHRDNDFLAITTVIGKLQ